jgi:hypothetical protein
MAIRTRAVYPDTGYVLPSGEQIAIVSEETLVDEAVAMLRVAYRVGGIVSVVQDRAQTGVPHEMVTVAAVVQWQDRTDAKPQPEPAVEPVPAREVEDYAEAVRQAGAQFADYAREQADDDWQATRAAVDSGAEIRVEAGTLSVDPEPEELEERLEQEAVVVGAPVGYETPTVRETAVSHGRPPREQGVGSGALPFQRGGEPGAPPEINLADVVSGSGVPDPQQVPRPSDPKAEFQFDDGLRESSLEEEDDSSIPENLR